MRRLLILAVLVAACGQAAGQSQAPAAQTPTTPILTVQQRTDLENTVLRIQLATTQLNLQVARLEAQYPGWTVDVNQLVLVPKPPGDKPAAPRK